jgi:hypothetical protein
VKDKETGHIHFICIFVSSIFAFYYIYNTVFVKTPLVFYS